MESVLRKTLMLDQFSWMENKFDIKLREGLTYLARFHRDTLSEGTCSRQR